MELYLMLAPFLCGAGLLVILPLISTGALAFTRYDALSPPVFNGLENLAAVIANPLYGIALRNTLLFLAMAVPLRLAGALALALLFDRASPLVGVYRSAIYIPTVIPDVAYALIWLWVFNPVYGPLNAVLTALGLPAPAWLSGPETARLAVVIMALFQVGEGFVALLAALQSVPPELRQAAALDGAGARQVFRYITFPLLMPWLLLLGARDLLVSMHQTFAPAFLMTRGGPYYATLFLPQLIYQTAFDRLRLGEAALMLLLLLGGFGALIWLAARWFRHHLYTDDL
jgi:multiple sugar transport system permease protein